MTGLGAPSALADDLKENFAVCINGAGKLPNDRVVRACTWLIGQAAQENEITALVRLSRASVNSNRQTNCGDARAALRVAGLKPNIRAIAEQMAKSNC